MAEYSQLDALSFDTRSLEFDIKNIESVDIEGLLTPIIQILKNEVHTATIHLEHHTETDEIVTEMFKLIHSTNLLRMHFEFTLAVFKSSSAEEVQSLKEKFTPIKHHYEQVKTKHDFTPVPAKYVVVTFYEKMVLAVISLFERCFKKNYKGQIRLVKNEDNLCRIKILTHRLLIGDSHYPQVVMFSKEDIFHYPRSHPVWQELHKSATFKEILNKEEATTSFGQFHKMSNIGHVIINKQNESSLYNVKTALGLLKDLIFYLRNHHEAETYALLRLANLKYEEAFQVWNLTEQPLVHQAMGLRHHLVGFDERIFLPRLFPKITKELIFQEYEENTINKIHPLDKSLFQAHDFSSIKGQIIDDLYDESEDKVSVRLLANEHLTFKDNVPSTIRGLLHKASKLIDWRDSAAQKDMEGTIVVHIHGGGFVSMSSGTHRMYLNRWVKNLKVAHFSIDYRLAPENKYPNAVDDVWQAYLWIVNYAETVLGIKNKKIIVTGDSAGGNLALALSLRLIRAGLQPPHGCLLMYPALILDTKVSSPSYFTSVDDSLLPTSLLKYAVKAYVGDEFKNLEDPFISPLFASPELLEKLPPIRMVVGSNDPLHDDSWRLLHKMRKLNKDVKLIVHEHIPHGYLCHSDLKNYGAYIEESCDLIRELAGMKNESN